MNKFEIKNRIEELENTIHNSPEIEGNDEDLYCRMIKVQEGVAFVAPSYIKVGSELHKEVIKLFRMTTPVKLKDII